MGTDRQILIQAIMEGRISKREAARQAGVHRRTIDRWVDGSTPPAPKPVVEAVKPPAKVVDVTVFLNWVAVLPPSTLRWKWYPSVVSIDVSPPTDMLNEYYEMMKPQIAVPCGVSVLLGHHRPKEPKQRGLGVSVPRVAHGSLPVVAGDTVYVVVNPAPSTRLNSNWSHDIPKLVSLYTDAAKAVAAKESDGLLYVSVVG